MTTKKILLIVGGVVVFLGLLIAVFIGGIVGFPIGSAPKGRWFLGTPWPLPVTGRGADRLY